MQIVHVNCWTASATKVARACAILQSLPLRHRPQRLQPLLKKLHHAIAATTAAMQTAHANLWDANATLVVHVHAMLLRSHRVHLLGPRVAAAVVAATSNRNRELDQNTS